MTYVRRHRRRGRPVRAHYRRNPSSGIPVAVIVAIVIAVLMLMAT